ncbi:MAG: ATP-binding protein [Halobacteria archaeon]|nr:ATP-binding protein [Halobacteria archaeon]
MDTVDIIELMLTAEVYNKNEDLDEDDLPPWIRKAAWNGEREIERPLEITDDFLDRATDGDLTDGEAWDAVKDLPFTDRENFKGVLKLTVSDIASDWYLDQVDEERIMSNPALAYHYQNDVDVDYEEARARNRPKESDAEWIHALVNDIVGEGEEAEEMLELVEVFAPEEIDISLDDIVLTEEQHEEVEKIMKAIEYREYLRDVGLKEIGKLLFVGPPGTGKTSTAKALSGRLDLPFVEVKLSMITSQYLGETAKNVDKVFEIAKRLSPCILFIDEFDSIAKTRDSEEHAALKRAVNTLLKSIDNISLVQDSVLLIGATNHPKLLDHAAWRRFDEILEFPAPDEEMRAKILEIITRDIDIKNFDAHELAERTEGLTGSDLRLILREAVLNALTNDRTMLSQQDLLDAVESFEKRKNLKEMDMIEGSPIGENQAEADGDGTGGTGRAHDHTH